MENLFSTILPIELVPLHAETATSHGNVSIITMKALNRRIIRESSRINTGNNVSVNKLNISLKIIIAVIHLVTPIQCSFPEAIHRLLISQQS